jgi:hypothetical protein
VAVAQVGGDHATQDHGEKGTRVKRADHKAEVLPSADLSRCDTGVSYIEVLVAIVLIGMTVLGTLTALRATILGSAVERDHARAHQWLQSASEVLTNDITWQDCETTTAAALQASYQSQLRGATDIVPPPWANSQVSVPIPVTFGQPDGTYGATCHPEIDRQMVRVQVVDTNHRIIETVDVVKVPPT